MHKRGPAVKNRNKAHFWAHSIIGPKSGIKPDTLMCQNSKKTYTVAEFSNEFENEDQEFHDVHNVFNA